MQFIENIQEILLGLCIAIMIPVIVHWGVKTFFSNNTQITVTQNIEQKNLDSKEIEQEKYQQSDKISQVNFWVYFITAIIAILIGSFIKINALSLGFIGGGFFNIVSSIANSQANSVINFGIFLFLFVILILIILIREKQSELKMSQR